MKKILTEWKKFLVEAAEPSFDDLFADEELMDIVDTPGGTNILHIMKRYLYEQGFKVKTLRRGIIPSKPKLSGTRWNFRKGPMWIQIRLYPVMEWTASVWEEEGPGMEKEISVYYKDPKGDRLQELGNSAGGGDFELQWPEQVVDQLKQIISQMGGEE